MTRFVGAAVFAAIGCAAVALDILNRRSTRSGPTFSQALSWLQARRAGQLYVFALWAFTGWHFFVR